MADNTTITGGDVVRDKDRLGVKTQIVALDLNPSGGGEVLQTAVNLGDGTSNPLIPSWGAFPFFFNETTWDRFRGTTANGLDVDVTRPPPNTLGLNTLIAPGSVAASVEGCGSVVVVITGTYTGANFTLQGTNDGTSWFAIPYVQISNGATVPAGTVLSSNNQFVVPCAGMTQVRCNLTALSTGGVTCVLTGSIGSAVQFLLPPTLTKGSQTLLGFPNQALKDSGRVRFGCSTVVGGVTAVTAEAMLSMVPVRDGVASAGVTTQPVTANKRLRITSMTVGLISTSAAVLSGRFVLRCNAAGAAIATSPIEMIVPVPSGAALAQAGGSVSVSLPDGLEFAANQQFGVTQVCSATTGTVWASLTGFEY